MATTARLTACLGTSLAGLRVGVLGGSFNPAHGGHHHISLVALKALDLDRVLWLVSPQNPLKPEAGMATLNARLTQARIVANDPRIIVSSLEAELGTRFTIDTLAALTAGLATTRFVWLMGSDNALSFTTWRRWRDIANLVPIAIAARPGSAMSARHAEALAKLARYRRPATPALVDCAAPAFAFLDCRYDASSATSIRTRGHWPSDV